MQGRDQVMSIFYKCFMVSLSILLLSLTVSCVHYTNRHKDHHGHSSLDQKEEVKKPYLNQIVKDLSFFPINGSRFRLSELKDIKAIVIIMREKDCPISEKYGPRLIRLEKEYSNKGIKFIYNYVGQVRTERSAKEDLARFGFKDSYVIDSRQTVINALGAETTGDVFILTPERKVIYRGPIDDQYHLLKTAPKVRNHYVLDRLSALISGQEIAPKELPAPGCIISRPITKKKSILKM